MLSLAWIKSTLIKIRDRYFVRKVHSAQCTQDYKPHDLAFSWVITVEHGSTEETCAIDANMTVLSTDRDMWTYTTNDKGVWYDFEMYRMARAKAITKEKMQAYI